jgi:hypothetical protein
MEPPRWGARFARADVNTGNGSATFSYRGDQMSESQLEAAAVPEYEATPEETGNYPTPDDGPQDDLEQTTTPQYDEDLVDGAGFGEEE